jgi:lysophospholipase L1-like esterase
MNVLALGDSIVWGQGHRDPTKFVNLVCAWLEARGEHPTLTSLAHSGAVVSPTTSDAAPALWGEVPESAPSITAQLAAAPGQVDPAKVDLVLMNGGINDISPVHIVVANPFDPNGLAKLGAQCQQVFGGPVRQLIDRTVAAFPTARIVVTGYYALVSEQTGLLPLVRLIKAIAANRDLGDVLAKTARDLPEELLALAIETERRRVIEQSALFARESTRLLKAAVAAHAATGRVFFADPGFGPANAFAAPATWQWSGSDDPLYKTRLDAYGEHPFEWPVVTPLASMGHPNLDGARAYAAAIEACLA